MAAVSTPRTLAEVLAVIAALPDILAGKTPDPTGLVASALQALGVEWLTITKDAYVTKARGGTDEAGIKWAPLKPETIAYGRPHPGLNARRKKAEAKGRAGRPLLTDALDRLWRGVYASTLRRLAKGGTGTADQKGQAASAAWGVVKAAGGQTILGRYGNVAVEIGRDTNRLLNSLSPGNPDSSIGTVPGGVTVTTNVEYAAPYHAKRPIWPDDTNGYTVPQVWLDRLAEILGDWLILVIERMVA